MPLNEYVTWGVTFKCACNPHAGNTQCLSEAKRLQEVELQLLSKRVVKPYYPREWLGAEDVEGIRRLVTGNSVRRTEARRCVKSTVKKLDE